MKKQIKVGKPKKKRKYTKKKLDLLSPIVNNMETKVDNALLSNFENQVHKSFLGKVQEEAVTLDFISDRLFAESSALQKSMERFAQVREDLADYIAITNLHVASINEQMDILLGKK